MGVCVTSLNEFQNGDKHDPCGRDRKQQPDRCDYRGKQDTSCYNCRKSVSSVNIIRMSYYVCANSVLIVNIIKMTSLVKVRELFISLFADTVRSIVDKNV